MPSVMRNTSEAKTLQGNNKVDTKSRDSAKKVDENNVDSATLDATSKSMKLGATTSEGLAGALDAPAVSVMARTEHALVAGVGSRPPEERFAADFFAGAQAKPGDVVVAKINSGGSVKKGAKFTVLNRIVRQFCDSETAAILTVIPAGIDSVATVPPPKAPFITVSESNFADEERRSAKPGDTLTLLWSVEEPRFVKGAQVELVEIDSSGCFTVIPACWSGQEEETAGLVLRRLKGKEKIID